MGFSSGGGGVLTNHTHDTGVTNDGGALAANATMFGLTAGSLLYSDGSNIQELGVGAASEQLAVNGAATAPEWVSAGTPGGGSLELIETKTSTGVGTTSFDFTFASPLNFSTDTAAMFWVVAGGADGSTDYRMRMGDTTAGAVFTTNYDLVVVGSATSTVTGEDYFTILPAGGFAYPEIAASGYITQGIDNDDKPYLYISANVNGKGYVTIIGGKNTTEIDNTLKYFSCYVATSYFDSGSSCTCYKVKRA